MSLRALAMALLLLLCGGPFAATGPRAAAAGGLAFDDTSIRAAVKACKAESAFFRCPKSEQKYGKMPDWDTSRVTDLSNREAASMNWGALSRSDGLRQSAACCLGSRGYFSLSGSIQAPALVY